MQSIDVDVNGLVSDASGVRYNLPWQFQSSVLVETNGISVVCIYV